MSTKTIALLRIYTLSWVTLYNFTVVLDKLINIFNMHCLSFSTVIHFQYCTLRHMGRDKIDFCFKIFTTLYKHNYNREYCALFKFS